MLSTHTQGQRCRGPKGGCRQKEEEEEQGREGAALPLRTAAAHCSRRQSSGSPILPGSYGSLRGTVPHRRWAQPGVGPLTLAAGTRYKVQGTRVVSLWGVSHAWCVPVLPSTHHPYNHNGSCLPVESLHELHV